LLWELLIRINKENEQMMKAEKHMQMMQMLQNCVIEKCVSHDEYEELIVRDKHGNKMYIKFYPNTEDKQNE
ncbi:MAG: hypothetical protein L0L07_05915, partial [Staphylococcus equorum]|nr:hypothetical protein [Staphylococcus equorum]